jgi:putative Mn2+ efflux pump MntP
VSKAILLLVLMGFALGVLGVMFLYHRFRGETPWRDPSKREAYFKKSMMVALALLLLAFAIGILLNN